jgi:enolase
MTYVHIEHITAREILDSRGKPTVEVEISGNGYTAKVAAPSGKSTGVHEAVELRDEEGGVSGALKAIESEIAPKLVEAEFASQKDIDVLLRDIDGTENFSRIGANAALPISIAVLRLAALQRGMELFDHIADIVGTKKSEQSPRLYVNVINGGAHADFKLPFQEYIIVPEHESSSDAYAYIVKTIEILGELIEERYGNVPLGDEGGYSFASEMIEEPFELVSQAIEKAGGNAHIAIDAAASAFFEGGGYTLSGEKVSPEGLQKVYEKITGVYALKSIEDPFEENDTKRFAALSAALPNTLIVGDDFTVTDPERIAEAAKREAANAVIIKPNQIGTVSDTLEAIAVAHDAGWKTIVSHRSGETLDTFIADLAVGVGAYAIKAGSPLQDVRRVKYERLLEIVD